MFVALLLRKKQGPAVLYQVCWPDLFVPSAKIEAMPQSRNRHGHPHQKKADVPTRQRVKGRIVWAILFAVFALVIAFSAAGDNYLLLALATAFGAIIGFAIGKNMEKDAAGT